MSKKQSKINISPIEEIIDEARNGKMYILVDDPDRENEGDLIVPAQMATPDAINFMAIKLIASGVAICAGTIKSPSFSLSGSSTSMYILPFLASSIISSIGEILILLCFLLI